MCLKCASSERDLSPPKKSRRYLKASLLISFKLPVGPLSLGSTVQELVRSSYVSSTVTNTMYVLQLEFVSITEHNFDQKYTTSRVTDDLHHQILHVTQVSRASTRKSLHPCRAQTAPLLLTVTAALRLDHPPLASVCGLLLQLSKEYLSKRMDRELFRFA